MENPNEQAATTTSVSNKEYSTYLPLSLMESKHGGNDPGDFANPFSDEVEAASMLGFFPTTYVDASSSNSNSHSSSYQHNHQYQVHDQNTGNQHAVTTPVSQQQQMCSTHQDPGPALPLHFQNSDSNPGLTQLDASSFVIGEIPSIHPAGAPSVTGNRNHNAGQGSSQARSPKPISKSFSHDTTNPQANSYPTQTQTQNQPNNLSYRPPIMNGNFPSTVSTTSMVSLQSSNAYSGIPTSIPVPNLAKTSNRRNKRKSTGGVTSISSRSHTHGPPPISEDEAEELKRRRKHERNLREQQRSHRITEQITELRKVLSDTGNIKFRKTDKYSVLCKAVEHIRELQGQCVTLDTEHQKLVETISQTSELVHSSASGINTGSSPIRPEGVVSSSQALLDGKQNTFNGDPNADSASKGAYIPEASTSTFFHSMALFDYKTIFGQCCAALAVFGLDGVMLDCNSAFACLSGFSKDPPPNHERRLNEMSLFQLFKESKDVAEICSVMKVMIEQNTNEPNFWSGTVSSIHEHRQNLLMNLTLTKNREGTPRFFNCALFAAT